MAKTLEGALGHPRYGREGSGNGRKGSHRWTLMILNRATEIYGSRGTGRVGSECGDSELKAAGGSCGPIDSPVVSLVWLHAEDEVCDVDTNCAGLAAGTRSRINRNMTGEAYLDERPLGGRCVLPPGGWTLPADPGGIRGSGNPSWWPGDHGRRQVEAVGRLFGRTGEQRVLGSVL